MAAARVQSVRRTYFKPGPLERALLHRVLVSIVLSTTASRMQRSQSICYMEKKWCFVVTG